MIFALRRSPDFRAPVVRFAAALGAVDPPADAAWMAAPVRQTAALFARALG